MEHGGADLAGGGEVADEGRGGFFGREPAANICLGLCNEINAFYNEGAVTVVVNRCGELPGSALDGDSADGLGRLVAAGAAEQHYGTESKRKQQPPTTPARAIVG